MFRYEWFWRRAFIPLVLVALLGWVLFG